MRITFKLFASLTDYLPQALDGHTRSGNELPMDLTVGTTVQQVIDRFSMPPKLVHLVLVNGVFIAPAARATHALAEGDALAIWPPVAGG
ncbi:MAG: sulfur carrier protein ThiS [Burkholderiaceae bacterium]